MRSTSTAPEWPAILFLRRIVVAGAVNECNRATQAFLSFKG
jgi:hypothetical protein